MPASDSQTGYAPVDDLSMYYEIHGEGPPLILLHAAYMTVDLMGPILSGLAATRQVIAPEQQGHGRTPTPTSSRPGPGSSTAPTGCRR
jgi:pimeloyl-ACP methyl ester carboxylesterase